MLAFTLIKQKSGAACGSTICLIDGQGVLAKGAVELDGDGELQSAELSPCVRDLRWRQDFSPYKVVPRRRPGALARGGARWRRLRRAKFRQDRQWVVRTIPRSKAAQSRSRPRHQARRGGRATTAKPFAASTGACRAAAAASAPSRSTPSIGRDTPAAQRDAHAASATAKAGALFRDQRRRARCSASTDV